MKTILFILAWIPAICFSQNNTSNNSQTLIYGYRDGHALVLNHMTPSQPLGRAIIAIANGNFRSDPSRLSEYALRYEVYVEEGFDVFVVATSSAPRYTIPEQLEDVKKSIRFVNNGAQKFNIDPGKIGITGASSGGNLALLAAMGWDKGDYMDSISGRVAAAAVFYPPTDFINYGKPNPEGKLNYRLLSITGLTAAFDFKRWNDTTRTFITITDTAVIRSIVDKVSPVNAISADDPPVYIIHGDNDILVPLQQSQLFTQSAEKAGVPVKLEIRKNGSHGWPNRELDERKFAIWFKSVLR